MKKNKYIKIVKWGWQNRFSFYSLWLALVAVGLQLYYFQSLTIKGGNWGILITGLIYISYSICVLGLMWFNLSLRKVRYIEE